MFCPQCGQEQINRDTRFCSRCGFLMTGVEKLISTGGALPEYLALSEGQTKMSARKRGLRQGALMFFSGIVIVPLLGILTAIMNGEGYIAGAAAIILFVGGFLRMIFALLFETSDPAQPTLEDDIAKVSTKLFNKKSEQNALPPGQSIPASDYAPPKPANWRETDDLTPQSVTEETTNLLDPEQYKR